MVIVCALLIGIVGAQNIVSEAKKNEKMVFLEQKNSKIAPDLEKKIISVKAEEELPVIIFYKKTDKLTKVQAQSAAVTAVEVKGGKVKHKYKLIDAISAKIPAGRIAGLAISPDIERIYYDKVIPLPPTQLVKPMLSNSTQTIGANYVWDNFGYDGTGIKVAVIDTGINYSHPDLGSGWGNRVIDGYDFYNNDHDPMDDKGHGTHVAGIIGANGSIKGVAPNVSFFALKVCGSDGCPTSNIIAGIDWSVANGADIISISLGGSDWPNDEFADVSNIVSDAAVDKGVVVVVAAGNEGPGTGTVASPGSARKVITVGASDSKGSVTISDDTIASFSTRGPSAFGRLDPDVVAPGVSINSTSYTGGYILKNGTSMATPHVSGAAALLLQKNPSLTPADVRRILMHTSSNITSHVFEKGAGIINVTKALTYNISATINGDDRWEESVLPGFISAAKLNLTNGNAFPVNFTFSLEGITDLEGINSLPSSAFSLPSSVSVPAMSTTTVDVSFEAPVNANPSIYGTTLIISNATAGTLRIPVAITIPLVGSGTIQGSVDDKGDWIYYKIKSYNGTSLNASLTWTDNNNLDLYLFAPNGVLVNSSTAYSGTSEQVSLSNMVYDEYWLAVHAFTLNGPGSYTLTVNYPVGSQGNIQVIPSSWQGAISSNEIKNITFTVINDAIPKSNLNLSVKKLMEGESDYLSGTIGNFASIVAWDVNSSGLNLNNTRYMNVTLRWVNPANNLDLNLMYNDETQWVPTRFKSEHNNSQLNQAWESLENVDIQHYLKSYPNFGIGINNTGSSETYNLTINFTDIVPWSGASVNKTTISLNSSETKQINVIINGYKITQNVTDLIFTIQNSTEDFAMVPIRINLYTIDTPPALTFVFPTPANNSYLSQNWLHVNITSDETLNNALLEWNGTNETMLGSGTNWYINKTNIQDGKYSYRVWGNDPANNWNVTGIRVVTIDTTPPTVIANPTTYPDGYTAARNNSIISFNVSASDSLSGLKNASLDASLINNTGIIELTNISGFWKGNVAFDKYVKDGNHSLNVTFFDNAGNINNSVVNVTIDNTPPSINISLYPSFTPAMNSYVNITANISDERLNTSNITVIVEYPGGFMNTSKFGTYLNFTNTSEYGRYNITITADDLAGNTNINETWFVTTRSNSTLIDGNNITVNASETTNVTLEIFTNQSVNGTIEINTMNALPPQINQSLPGPALKYFTISVSNNIKDNLSWIKLKFYYTQTELDSSNLKESSLELARYNESSKQWQILSRDSNGVYDTGVETTSDINGYAGYVWANLSSLSNFAIIGEYPTIESGNSYTALSGGGGGGRGPSGENYSNIEVIEKYDLYIYKDKTTSYRFTNSSNPIIFVNITGNINAGEIRTSVEVLKNTSSLVTTPSPGKVYKNINIWVGSSGFAVPKNIKIAIITFRIENVWLASHGFSSKEVALYQWYDKKWNKLETSVVGEHDTYTFFEAKTNRFSPFAISAISIKITPHKTPLSLPTANVSTTEEKKKSPGFEIVLVLIAMIYLIKKR